MNTCWRVKKPGSLEEYDHDVKDRWASDDVPAEYDLLELAKGVPGVIQMASYETDSAETKDSRCSSTVGGYRNRVAARITTKSYEKTIENFTSKLQVIRAIRDAIAGMHSI